MGLDHIGSISNDTFFPKVSVIALQTVGLLAYALSAAATELGCWLKVSTKRCQRKYH